MAKKYYSLICRERKILLADLADKFKANRAKRLRMVAGAIREQSCCHQLRSAQLINTAAYDRGHCQVERSYKQWDG
jgi:hypothetical protein